MKLLQNSAVLILLSTFLGAATSANDTMATLGAGGLIPLKSSEIVLESEDLEISIHQIKVRYRFHNTSDRDIDGTVAFPLPALDGGTLENEPLDLPSKDSLNFVSFHVQIDGQPVSTEVEVRAFKDGKDITSHLESLGLPVSLMAARRKEAISKLAEAQRMQLEREGLLVADEIRKPGSHQPEKYWWPWWEMRVQYYWTQHFPAKGTIEVLHTYSPVVGGSYIVKNDSGELSIKPYCGNSATLQRIQEAKSRHLDKKDSDIVLLEKRVKYILTTANNWRGPIVDFHLVIDTEGPDDIFVACVPGLKRISPTRYEYRQANFRPDRELDLLILQASK